MRFFYKSKNTNEPIEETLVVIDLDTPFSGRSNLDAIAECEENARAYFSGDSFTEVPDSQMTCEFVYHLGATVYYR